MAHEVFISHSSKDKAAADAVCAGLESAGIRCWIAPRDIRSGERWADAIVKAIQSSRLMVLIFSSNSNNSKDVAKELTVAVNAGVIVIPFKIDDIMPAGIMEYYLSDTHWLDAMNPPTQKQIGKLIETAGAVLRGEYAPGPQFLAHPGRTAQKHIIAYSVAAVLIFAIAVVFYSNRRAAGPAPPAVVEEALRHEPEPEKVEPPVPQVEAPVPKVEVPILKEEDDPAVSVVADDIEAGDDPVEREDWTSPETGMEFVWIPEMEVWVGRFEVTNEEYRMKEPGHDSGEFGGYSLNDDRQPVVGISFDEAKEYAEWLTRKDQEYLPEGVRYRLPAVYEWIEFARAGDGRSFPWGDVWPPVSGQAGNYRDEAAQRAGVLSRGIPGYNDGHPVTAPVDELWANPWGLHGVGGNVWEACASGSDGEIFGDWKGASWYGSNQRIILISSPGPGGGMGRLDINAGFRLVAGR